MSMKKQLKQPQSGGSFTRDKDTGALTKNEPPKKASTKETK